VAALLHAAHTLRALLLPWSVLRPLRILCALCGKKKAQSAPDLPLPDIRSGKETQKNTMSPDKTLTRVSGSAGAAAH